MYMDKMNRSHPMNALDQLVRAQFPFANTDSTKKTVRGEVIASLALIQA